MTCINKQNKTSYTYILLAIKNATKMHPKIPYI